MDRRGFLLTSLAGAFAVPLAAEAQQAGKVWRGGFLGGPDHPAVRAGAGGSGDRIAKRGASNVPALDQRLIATPESVD